MPQLQFAAQAYQSRSAPLESQQCINMFVEKSPPEAKDSNPVFMAPGLTAFSRLGRGPINGLHVASLTAAAGKSPVPDVLYAISGGQLFSVNTDGLATFIGTTNLGGIVISADNGTQLVMVDGNVGWVYQPAGLNLVTLDTALAYTLTSLSAAAAEGDTTLTVTSIARLANGDNITLNLDNGGTYSTTISGTPSGSTVPIAGTVPSAASVGAGVYDYSQGANTITVAAIGSVVVGDTINLTLDSGVIFTTTISSLSGPQSELVITLASGVPSQASAGAIATIAGNVLGQINAPAFMAASTVVYFDDYFVFDARGTNEFFLSGLGDGTQYNGLDFASAQADPDLVLAVVNYHEQLLIFGEKTIEVWYDAGAANFPFQRFDGAFVQRGLASPQATVKEDNTVFWLGEDGLFYRLNGYSPQRISTFGTEHPWAQYPTISDANCFVVTMEGHKFLFLTFPSGNATWCYDISSDLWHQRESWGSPWL